MAISSWPGLQSAANRIRARRTRHHRIPGFFPRFIRIEHRNLSDQGTDNAQDTLRSEAYKCMSMIGAGTDEDCTLARH